MNRQWCAGRLYFWILTGISVSAQLSPSDSMIGKIITGNPCAYDGKVAYENYLCKYGYMSNAKCFCNVLPLSVNLNLGWQTLQSALFPTNCSDLQFSAALFNFQTIYNIPATGRCDVLTLRLMLAPRCGVADDVLTSGAVSVSHSIGQPSTAIHKVFEANPLLTRVRRDETAAAEHELLKVKVLEAPGRLDPSRGTESISGERKQRRSVLQNLLLPRTSHNSLKFETREQRFERSWKNTLSSYKAAKPSSAVERLGGDEHVLGRRSTVINNASFTFLKTCLKWRIISYNNILSNADQDAAMDTAFRAWAAVTPLSFVNDQVSNVNSIDILIAFYSGSHAGDSRPFDGPGGELAHSYPGLFTHFDNTESWYTGTVAQSGVALSAVALHEFGHVIGLPHSISSSAVMYSLYSSAAPNTLLTDADRAAALSKYGPCSGSFDTILDAAYNVLTLDSNGNLVTFRYFSTYFFRGSVNWLYVNSWGRAGDNEPETTSLSWGGIPDSVDAFVQYTYGSFDQSFFFKGSTVYLYNYLSNVVTNTYAISTHFPSGSIGEPIPNNIDTAYFDPRDNNIYFFKGTFVYIYHYNSTASHSCCVSKGNIADVFPIATGQPATVGGVTYQQNVDSVYRSLYSNSLYFFVGNNVWKNQYFDGYSNTVNNSMTYLGTWNQFWNYICTVTC